MTQPNRIEYTKSHQSLVKEFMTAFGQWLPKRAKKVPELVQRNRVRMIAEETMEWLTANTVIDRVDAIVDMWYVALGATLEHKINFDTECSLSISMCQQVKWPKKQFASGQHVQRILWELSSAVPNPWVMSPKDECVDLIRTTADCVANEMNTLGITLECFDELFKEVHRSNMSKMWGGDSPRVVRDKSGKVMKPPTYSPPNLKPILERYGVSCT